VTGSLPELPPLPLVGRADELAALRAALDRAEAGQGGTLFLAGGPGAGKTRLAQAAREEADRRGFLVAAGSAYPMEGGVPYAVFCDLLDPLVSGETREALVAWTRGAPEFRLVCPSLAVEDKGPTLDGRHEIPDLRNRLLWNVPSFLNRLRRDRPLLLVLEDLQWADPSSLELLHFLGRRSGEHPFLILGSFRPGGSGVHADVGDLARGLAAGSSARVLALDPLDPDQVAEAVARVFEAAPEVVRGFSLALHRWTGGNPFFVRSMLEGLVGSGQLRREGGRWVGWTLDSPALPTSIRDVVRKRVAAMGGPATRIVELAAVVGARASFQLLREASGMPDSDLLAGLKELRERRFLEEAETEEGVVYFFVHPVVRGVIYDELGLARSRLLHMEMARALERMHGDEAMDHASELAAHFLHGAVGDGTVDRERAAAYLAAAGRDALASHGNREAAAYLGAALDLLHDEGGDRGSGPDRYRVFMDLARARQRLGHHDAAEEVLRQARKIAAERSDHVRMAEVELRLGFTMLWAGRLDEAIARWEEGLEGARLGGDVGLEARIRVARSACLQEAGRPEEAAADAREALRIGEAVADRRTRYTAHRTLALLHAWTGPPDTARDHGRQALVLAEELESEPDLFSAHRAMAIVAGLTGHPQDTRRHLNAASRLAERLGSPLLRLKLADVWIEYSSATGHWNRGIDMAEESIRMARELNQRVILTRLLVWSGLLHLERGDFEIGRDQITEAWEIAGLAEGAVPTPTHTATLAHTGRAALHLASGDYAEALRVGDAGMELVDRSGNRAWAIHRLLPIMGEAALHLRDLGRARQIADQLRRESTAFGHLVGLVWAQTCDALVTWLAGDVEEGARQMAAAAERLESVETVPYAARLRRQLAGRLADLGERDAAIRELRRVHDILAELGAEPELNKARGQFREVGARPPSRGTVPGSGDLTAREMEVARLVGERKSNKAIGKELGISHRTVGTHLSNTFRKLEVDSRSQLGDLVRAGLLEGRR
jgi:DNA-binding CsgD family transcriptional regulator